MRVHVEIGHLIKYDAFRLNRNRVTDLEMWFKIHANVSTCIFEHNDAKDRKRKCCLST